MTGTEQIAFDIDALIAEANPEPARPPYTGPRVGFHQGPITTADAKTIEAEARYLYGNFGIAVGFPHIWMAKQTSINTSTPGHHMAIYWADLRCDYERDVHTPGRSGAGRCLCVGSLVERAICGCGWCGPVDEGNRAIEAWHDHAWPGWRELPVVPQNIRPIGGGINKSAKAAFAWVREHYPSDWQVSGAPVITERADIGRAHVSGYSPWGGFDIAAESAGIDIARAS